MDGKMYKITEENRILFTQAFNLLNEIEVKGILNINALGNSATMFRQFFDSMEIIDDEKNINKEKENDK